MKKLLSILLALTLVLSLSAFAFAETDNGDNVYDDWSPITIKKEVKLTNPGTVHPAEIFNFTIGSGTVLEGNAASAPAFEPNTFTIDVGEGDGEGSTNINLPEFTDVGVYSYPVFEVPGNTAGMVYHDGETAYELVVTVINNPDGDGFLRVLTLTDENNVKDDAFENEFSAGKLVITKKIEGNYAVYSDEFEVTVTLTSEQGKVIKEGPISVTGAVDDIGSVVKNEDGTVTVTFKVTDGSEVIIDNIPYDVSYEVAEESGNYTATIEGATGVIGESQTVAITNRLDKEIQAGVNLDSLPYLLLLVGAVVGLFGFAMKRRLAGNR